MAPLTSHNFAQAAEIRVLTSQSMSPDAWNSDPRCSKLEGVRVRYRVITNTDGSRVCSIAIYSVFSTFIFRKRNLLKRLIHTSTPYLHLPA